MRIKITVVFVLLAAAFVFFVFKGKYLNFDETPVLTEEAGQEFKSSDLIHKLAGLELRNYQSNKVTLSEDELKSAPVLVLHLWASWCSPCVNEVPELISFSKAHPEVKFVVVSLDEYQEDIAKFLKSFPEFDTDRYVRLWDRDNTIAKMLNADRLPMSIIMKKGSEEPQVVRSVVDWKSIKI
jgi:thiol-disulfide isomerase/thioredoxin